MFTCDTFEQDIQTRDLYRILDTRTCYSLLSLKGILLVAAIVLISSSKEISKAKPCDLENVLVSLSVNHTSPCKYDGIQKKSTTLCNFGISLIVLNAFSFLLILNFLWNPKKKEIGIFIALEVIAVVAVIYSCLAIKYYKEVLDSIEKQTDTHECCAIHQVQRTTNDFDGSPWCTTSGTCQSTAPQIPKTCCKYVTEDNYQSAPGTCHSSVNPRTYKSNCMISIKKLSTVNIEVCQINLLPIILLTIGTLEIAEVLIEGVWMLVTVFGLFRDRILPQKIED